MGYLSITFDQPLHVFKGIPVCPNWCSQATSDTATTLEPGFDCPPCDYTNPSVCDGTFVTISPQCYCSPNFCAGGSVSPLPLDTWTYSEITSEAGSANFYVNRPQDTCEAVVIRYQHLTGMATEWDVIMENPNLGEFEQGGVEGANFLGTNYLRGNRYATICPWMASPVTAATLTSYPQETQDGLTFRVLSTEFIASTRSVKDKDFFMFQQGDSFANCQGPPGLPTYDPTTVDYPIPNKHMCFPMGEFYQWDNNNTQPSGFVPIRAVVPLPEGQCTTFHFGVFNFFLNYLSFSLENPWAYGNETYLEASHIFYFSPTPYSSPQNGWTYADDEFLISVCTQPGEKKYLYIYLESSYAPLRIWIDNSKNWMDLIPFSNISQYAFPNDFFHAYTLDSKGKKFTPSHDNVQNLGPWDQGILNTRMIYPTESPNYFYPPMSSFRFDSSYSHPIINQPPPFLNNTVVIGVILDWDLQTQSNFQLHSENILPMKHQFLTEEEFFASSVTFHGKFGNEDWEPYVGTVKDFVRISKPCDPKEFFEAQQELNDILQGLNTSPDILSASAAAYTVANSNAYAFCYDEFLSWFDTAITAQSKTVEDLTYTCPYDFDTPSFATESCCNFTFDYLKICNISDKEFTIPEVRTSSNWDQCAEPVCAKNVLEGFAHEVTKMKDPTSCTDLPLFQITLQQELAPFLKCRRKFFYHYPDHGIQCKHDFDCPNGGICSRFRENYEGGGECLYDISAQIDGFLKCMLEDVRGPILVQAMSLLNITNMTVENFRAALQKDGCNDRSNKQLAFLEFEMDIAFVSIFNKPARLFDLLDIWIPTSLSTWVWTSILNYDAPTIAEQCAAQFCNWNSSSTSSEDCLADPGSFCGLCENGEECKDYTNYFPVPFTEATCNDAVLCILNNGTEILVSSPEMCLNTYSCDRSCNGVPCTTEGDCESDLTGW